LKIPVEGIGDSHGNLKRKLEEVNPQDTGSESGCDSFNENLVGFIEIDAKTMGLWVLGTIAIFAAFTMMVPLFSAF